MARFFLASLILCFFVLLFPCHAQVIHFKSKQSLVKGILQKVFNLTLASFAVTPIEEREKMMVKIEEKLNKSAHFLGPKREKYVGLIMEGVKSIASTTGSNNIQSEMYSTHERLHKINSKFLKTNIKKATKQIKSDVDKSLKHTKKQVKPNFKQDAGLINRGIVALKQKVNTKDNEARRMEFEFVDKINVNKDHDAKSMRSNSVEVSNASTVGENKIEQDFFNVTLKLPCQHIITNTCNQIKALRNIECSNKSISVEKLCDGIDDCFDYSDERDCAIQGVDKVRSATQLMSDVEDFLSNNCLASKVDDSLIIKQNEILLNALQTQLKFIQKHATVKTADSPQTNLRKMYSESEDVKKTVNEVAIVITTLSMSLERTLCSSIIKESRKYDEIEDEIQQIFDPASVKTSTSDCQCIEENCVGICSEDCDLVCLQRYQMSRWQCNAVSNKNTISLDLICDGKLDCYDEADESECVTVSGFAKFEANTMYNLVLNMIHTKAKAINFKKVRSMLVDLQKLVENLQKLTTKPNPDLAKVKALRDKCFLETVAIYDQIRNYKVSMGGLNDIHVFLMSVNEKLVNAMKRSSIGNDKMISSAGCFCRDNKCALLKCTKECIRACPAEPKLTRYFCGGSAAVNQSIPIEAICNGKDDCPDKDDEKDCSKEICRGHHLVVLRHNLKKAAQEYSGTTVGEALKIWKTKQVSAILKVMESNERPSPKILRDVANEMLHDLVMSYATLTSSRRNNDQIIDQFYKMTLVVIDSLKSCGKS